jgi:hypothetical protein
MSSARDGMCFGRGAQALADAGNVAGIRDNTILFAAPELDGF